MARSRIDRPSIIGPDGSRIFLDELPLSVYALECGHTGKQYGVVDGDIIFCDGCGKAAKVVRIILP